MEVRGQRKGRKQWKAGGDGGHGCVCACESMRCGTGGRRRTLRMVKFESMPLLRRPMTTPRMGAGAFSACSSAYCRGAGGTRVRSSDHHMRSGGRARQGVTCGHGSGFDEKEEEADGRREGEGRPVVGRAQRDTKGRRRKRKQTRVPTPTGSRRAVPCELFRRCQRALCRSLPHTHRPRNVRTSI